MVQDNHLNLPAFLEPAEKRSSWNSRNALLQKISRNHHYQPLPTKVNNQSYGKKFLARIGCNCYYKDKNSVDVDDQLSEKSFNRRKFHGKSKQSPIKTRSSESTTTGANHQDLHFKKIDELELRLKTDEHFVIPVFDPKGGNPSGRIQE
ncbi:hypothetical protein BC332_03163 [Capsicum chinense]|nr:hypothetical protein BC332_03163 [Capsicum chinense]